MTTESRIANAAAKAEAMMPLAEIRRGDESGEWLVLSSDQSTVYHTTIDECSCPAGTFNQPCYHRAMISALEGEQAPIVPAEPTCRECGKQYQTSLLDIGLCALCALN